MMRLLTNFNKKALNDVIACAKMSGLKGEIRKDAYDYMHQFLPGDHALWFDETMEGQTEAVERFFYCTMKLHEKIEKIFILNNIPEHLYLYKELYRGCEKDYFPEYTVDYSKLSEDK